MLTTADHVPSGTDALRVERGASEVSSSLQGVGAYLSETLRGSTDLRCDESKKDQVVNRDPSRLSEGKSKPSGKVGSKHSGRSRTLPEPIS